MATSAPDLSAADGWLAARSRDDRKRLGQWPTPWWACDAVAERAVRGLPAQATVVNEAVTFGRAFVRATHAAAPHDWLTVPGGAILVGAGVGPSMIIWPSWRVRAPTSVSPLAA